MCLQCTRSIFHIYVLCFHIFVLFIFHIALLDDFFVFTFHFSKSFFSVVKIAIYLINLIILSMKKIFFLLLSLIFLMSAFSLFKILWLWFFSLLVSFKIHFKRKIYFKCSSDVLLTLLIKEIIRLLLFLMSLFCNGLFTHKFCNFSTAGPD